MSFAIVSEILNVPIRFTDIEINIPNSRSIFQNRSGVSA